MLEKIKSWICGQQRQLRFAADFYTKPAQGIGDAGHRHGEVAWGTGQRLGAVGEAVGETIQCTGSLLISLLVWWIFQWGAKERKRGFFVSFGFFVPCYKASVSLWRSGSWLVASPLLLPVSSPRHALPRQNLSKPRSICQAFLLSLKSSTALIFITWAKQPTPFSLCDTGNINLNSSVPKV